MRPTWTAMAAAVAALAIGIGSAAGSGTAAATTYNDSVGERADAPDIGAVTVSLDGDVISINVSGANMPALFESGSAIFGFDVDRNPTNGGPFGDYALFVDWKTLGGAFLRWNGSDYAAAERKADPVRYLVGSSSVGLMINRANLGDGTGFDFIVVVGRGEPEEGRFDRAPDSGVWSFAYAAAPQAAEIESMTALFTPAQPRAGKRFALRQAQLQLSNGETVAPETITCVARLNGRVLKPVGRCAWKLPAGARGKRLAIVLTPTYAGKSGSFDPWTFRVR